MDKDDVLKWLLANFSNFSCHPKLRGELAEIICGSGYEDKLFKIILTRLRQLSLLGLRATNLEEFEPLGGGLFSLHCSGKGFNMRIIYAFLSSGAPALLYSFYERGGKNKTDYTIPIKVAKQRLSEMKGKK